MTQRRLRHTGTHEAICGGGSGGSSAARAHLRAHDHQLANDLVQPNDGSYDTLAVWSATGSAPLPTGAEFAIDRPLEGFTESNATPADLYVHNFAYQMDVDAGRGGEWTTSTAIHPGDLAEGSWVDSRGTPLDTPCTHEPCAPLYAYFNNRPQPTGMPTESRPTFTPAPAETVAP